MVTVACISIIDRLFGFISRNERIDDRDLASSVIFAFAVQLGDHARRRFAKVARAVVRDLFLGHRFDSARVFSS